MSNKQEKEKEKEKERESRECLFGSGA